VANKVKQCKNCAYRLTRDQAGHTYFIGSTRVYKCTLHTTTKALTDSCKKWSDVNAKSFQLSLNFERR